MTSLIKYHSFLTLFWERERNVLFNDALNTFYLWLYGVRLMVKDHSDSEKGNPLPPHRLLLSINSKGSFICTIPQTGSHIPRPLLHQSWSTGWNENKFMNECIWCIARPAIYKLDRVEHQTFLSAVACSTCPLKTATGTKHHCRATSALPTDLATWK